jgi:hypothetical protein
MASISPVCTLFVLQIGPNQATNGALSTPKPPQKLIFVCKITGTSTKTTAKRPFFNSFPVPQNEWDKLGTSLGQAKQRDTEIKK